MKYRADRCGWIGRLIEPGEEFEHASNLSNWATALEPWPEEAKAALKKAADELAAKKADEEAAAAKKVTDAEADYAAKQKAPDKSSK